MEELWRKYRNTNYFVSNTGKIKNKDKILKGSISKDGYRLFDLGQTVYVHRAVAELFVSNLETKSDVRHKNGDKNNNSADNLEWMSSCKESVDNPELFGENWLQYKNTKYWVSDKGYVWNGNVVMRGSADKAGYRLVTLRLQMAYATKRIHRVVAELFLENPENKPEVNHIDGNKQNNCVSNLEWVTPKENVLHAMHLGLKPSMKGSNSSFAKLTEKDIPEIRELLKSGLFSHRQIAKEFGVSNGAISAIRRGQTWTHV